MVMKLLFVMKCLVLVIGLSAFGTASVAQADDLLQSYEIRDAVEYGVVKKLHEDDRGVYYWGPLMWNDPQYDPDDYEVISVVALIKPEGNEGFLLRGTG